MKPAHLLLLISASISRGCAGALSVPSFCLGSSYPTVIMRFPFNARLESKSENEGGLVGLKAMNSAKSKPLLSTFRYSMQIQADAGRIEQAH